MASAFSAGPLTSGFVSCHVDVSAEFFSAFSSPQKKDDSGSYAVFTETRIISIANDSRKKTWISSPDCQIAMDKQQTQYRLTPK